MELLVLTKLKWDLASVTPLDFLDLFMSRLPIRTENRHILRKHAQTFVALCANRCMVIHTVLLIPDVKFIASPPSMVAAGSLVASVKGLQMRIVDNAMTEQNLTENLAQIIRSDPDCLRACQEQIESLFEMSLCQAQLQTQQPHSGTTATKGVMDGESQELSATPTDVRDVNI
ncbi:unnamed protein product [Arctogadus glacialis]